MYPAPEGGGTDAEAHRTHDVRHRRGRRGSVKELGEIDKDGYDFVVHAGVVRYASGEDNNLKEHVYYRCRPPTAIGRP